jgi:hypothetical protein
MIERQRVFYRIGAWAWLLTAGLHLLGHFSGPAAPANPEEAELLRLMTDHVLDLMGVKLTMLKLVDGLSLSFSALLALVGLLDLAVVRALPQAGRLGTQVAALNAAGAGALLAIGLGRFPPPPLVCFGVILAAFAASLPGSSEGEARRSG